jgi:hypothetical protein
MNTSIPNVILYGQALSLIQQIADSYNSGNVRNVEDAAQELRQILTEFESSSGKPQIQYDPFAEGEPVLSKKVNQLWGDLQNDVNILQNQLDVLRAAAVFTHNIVTTETLRSAAENARVNNKLKTLQLYSDNVDSNIVTFGDSFHDDQFIDESMSQNWQQPLIDNGIVTLGQQGNLADLSTSATVYILPSSNGFAGNNQEVNDPTNAPTDPLTNQKMITFVAETNAADNLVNITDGQPDRWFEYEHVKLSEDDKFKAGNFNFSYKIVTGDQVQMIDWSSGPSDNTLQLNLMIKLADVENINYIAYTPYGLKNNANPPVVVRKVQVSANGTDWIAADPSDVWIATDPNLVAARSADNVVIGTATWNFPSIPVQYIQIAIAQPLSVPTNIGHVYFVKKDSAQRVEGPAPTLPIGAYYDPDGYSFGDTLQGREVFDGQRWAIGIKDIAIQKIQYVEQSVIVTKPLLVGGLVDRVSLEASIYIPPDYPPDSEWVSFFISPDDGATWNQISRIQDDFLDIPEIIAYNDPLPEAFREPGVSYYSVSNPVTSLRLQILITRPNDQPSSTPFVQSYKLKVRTR